MRPHARQSRIPRSALLAVALLPAFPLPSRASTYYVSPSGSDSAAGTLASPFASIAKAQSAAASGDTIYLRGGTYTNFSVAATDATYQYVLNITKSNLSFLAYPGDPRPVLNVTNIATTTLRTCAIQVTGSGDTFKGFDVTGVNAGTLKQADNWRITGSSNTLNNICTHDDQGNGVYIFSHASNTLCLNCDDYDLVGITGTSAGNTDGFGCHSAGSGNIFRACRSWANSDDGYDCINNTGGGVTFDHCWSYSNGRNGGDANGFKVGGFGDTGGAFPDPPPVHTVEFCVSAKNGAHGFYANHQPGQAANWLNNTSYANSGPDFDMLEAIDTSPEDSSVPGTREIMHNNLAYVGTSIADLGETGPMVSANSFTLPVTVNAADFQSLDYTQLTLPRKTDGSLPDITFLHLTPGSDLIDAGQPVGFPYIGNAPDLGAFEIPEPALALPAALVAAFATRRIRPRKS